MVKQQFTLRGKTMEELSKLSHEEFSKLLTSRERRHMKRGFTKRQRKLLLNIKNSKNKEKPIRTHDRDMIILPEMVGYRLGIHNGKEYVPVIIVENMVGHRLGEFSQTRKKVTHSAPGFGATRSSKFVPLK